MKKLPFILALIIPIVMSSCSTVNNLANASPGNQNLAGEWVLTYITGPRITFDGLFPENKPSLTLDIENKRIGGNNSCNSYGGDLVVKQDSIKIDKTFSTMMACPGNGEKTYMSTLEKIKTFKVQGDSLSLYLNEVEMMRFKRK